VDAVGAGADRREVRAEFTVFPFRESEALPAHARAAVDAARTTGADVDVGPLSNVVAGEVDVVLESVRAAAIAAFAAGATRFAVNVEDVS
jgi:uncharacterized protein YqgV (UPF0045/DUF77 family)